MYMKSYEDLSNHFVFWLRSGDNCKIPYSVMYFIDYYCLFVSFCFCLFVFVFVLFLSFVVVLFYCHAIYLSNHIRVDQLLCIV